MIRSNTIQRIIVGVIVGLWLGWIWGFGHGGWSGGSDDTQAWTQPQPGSSFEQAFRELAGAPELLPATIGISLRDLQTGEVLAEVNGSKSLIPASTMKLLVTSYAMSQFPSDQRWLTQLILPTPVQGGRVETAVILGSGDPTLGSPQIEGNPSLDQVLTDITSAIQTAGISEIDTLTVNTHVLQIEPIPWSWSYDDIGNYFGAPIRALNIYDNLYGLTFRPGSVGAPAEWINIEPTLDWIQFSNSMRTGPAGSGDQGYIFGMPEVNQRWLRGTIPAGEDFTIYGSMPDPVDAFLRLLQRDLATAGIRVNRLLQQSEPMDRGTDSPAVIWQQASPPLLAMVQQIHETSFNLYADTLLALTSQQQANPEIIRDWFRATEREQSWLQQIGIGIQGFDLKDGSGLSPRNVITANGMTSVLAFDAQQSWWPNYLQTLAIRGGQDRPSGSVRGKTGFISGVRTLSGVIQCQSGRLLAFSVLINHFEGPLAGVEASIDRFLDGIWLSY